MSLAAKAEQTDVHVAMANTFFFSSPVKYFPYYPDGILAVVKKKNYERKNNGFTNNLQTKNLLIAIFNDYYQVFL